MKNQNKNRKGFVSKPMTMVSKRNDSGYNIFFLFRPKVEMRQRDRKCLRGLKNKDVDIVKQQIAGIYYLLCLALFFTTKTTV